MTEKFIDDQNPIHLEPIPETIAGILLDVDGTLVVESGEMPSPRVTDAIIEAASAGIKVGLATSNPIYQMHRLMEHLRVS